MAKVYDNPINLSTNWGGDSSTGNLPVSGRRVQELIKNTFAKKGGCMQIKDKKFLQIFADEASMRKYNSNTEKYEDLVVSQVQLPNTGATQATMKVTVLGIPSEYSTKGRSEVFSFLYNSYYENEEDFSQVSGSCVVYVNNIQRERISLRAGNTYDVDVSKYLSDGTNEVKFTIDNAEQSKRNYVYEIQMVNLKVISDFDYISAYNGVVPFTYTPIGNITKTVHILMDGVEIHSEETDVNNRQLSFDIPAQSHGAHTLEVYLTATIKDIALESERLKFSVICVEDGNDTPVIASSVESVNMTQYETVTIPFVVYDPLNNPADITLSVDQSTVATRQVDRTQQSWIYKALSVGDGVMSITCRGVSKTFALSVGESIITSKAETQNLELFLTSQGRSNQDADREVWENNGIKVSFEGMNYTTNGWVVDSDGNTAMRLSGGATMEIPLQLFAKDIRQTGKTVELEFAVRQITDYTSVVLSCLQGGIGLELTPNTIMLTSEQSSMETKYKEDERVRVSFVIEKRANNRLMQIYINGIKSQSIQYPDNDGFMQAAPVGITANSATATLDIYNIRVYSNNLKSQQLLDNYIADLDDIEKKMAIFKRNQVYDTYGNLSYNALLEQIPCLTITGGLSQYKGDKKTVSIEYVDRNHHEKSFTADGVVLNVQGTSSQYYPRKNYKGQFKNGFDMTESGKHEDAFTLDENAVLPAVNFCWKADFAESSGTHNTGLANYIGWMLKEAGILTEPQKKNGLIRTTVYGEPCLIFHRASAGETPQFIGKYNFNTDKSAENTFGFADGDESWEFLNNTSDRSLFLSADFEGDAWKNDFEGRYPDGNEDISHMKEVFAWVVSCKDDFEKFKNEFDEHFDKKTLIFYYLITLVFGMVDQRAKNQFLTYYSGGKWLFIFYDNDTVFGINNEGAIEFSYNIEVHDVIGNLNAYNGANSLLWELVEQAFASDIQAMYQNLRQKGILSYDNAIKFCNTRQSDKWCEAVYNEDGYYKYESPLIDGYMDYSSGSAQTVKTGAFLYALQGSRDAHRRWWLYNRFKYMDSKFQAGSSLSDYITFRTYTPSEWSGVEPKADITIGSFTAMYGTIRWGSITKSERMGENEVRTITAPANTQFNDTETIIYNASMIKSIGDLSALYVGTVDVSKATNITELVIGSSVSGYKNQNFKVLSLGTNAKLRKLDIQNCPNYTASIDVSGCENIEEIYARGTGATAVTLAEGGSLRILQLPATITNLTLKNQTKLGDGLTLEGMTRIIEIVVENCPNIDSFAMVKSILLGENALQRVRITGIKANESNFEMLYTLAKLKGIGDYGEVQEHAFLSGTYHVPEADLTEIEQLNAIFPYLKITATKVIKLVPVTFDVVSQLGTPIEDAQVTIDGNTYSLASGPTVAKVLNNASYSYKITYDEGKSFSDTVYVGDDPVTVSKQFTVSVWVEVTFNVSSQYGNISDAKVTINNKTYSLAKGSAVVKVKSDRSYSYTITYDGGKTSSGSVTVAKDPVVVTKTFTVSFDAMSMKPEANGKIQFLVGGTTPSFTLSSGYSGLSVDWGDGTTDGTTSHTYTDGDSFHNVSVSVANCAEIKVASSNLYAFWSIGDNMQIVPASFSGYSNLQYVGSDIFKNFQGTNMSSRFKKCSKLKSIPSGLFDNCPNVTDFLGCFCECSSLTEIPAGLFANCTKVEQFGSVFNTNEKENGCFEGCYSLTEIPADLFDNCTNVTSFCGCFALCYSLTEIPAGLFDDCLNVTDFSACFFGCSSLTEIPSGLFDNCTKVTMFGSAYGGVFGCFQGCSSLTEIPSGLFDNCTNVTSFLACFQGCSSLTEIPADLFDNCPNVTDFRYCFQGCSSLTEIPADLFDNCTKVTMFGYNYSRTGCFEGCSSLAAGFIPFAALLKANYGYIYNSCSMLTKLIANSETPVSINSSIPNNSGLKIYVPDSAIETYKTATNWSAFADKIVGFSELTDEEKMKYGITA